MEQLKGFWLVAARSAPDHLTKKEFYIALRLIAYAQNGIQATEENVKKNIEVGFPKFDADEKAAEASKP